MPSHADPRRSQPAEPAGRAMTPLRRLRGAASPGAMIADLRTFLPLALCLITIWRTKQSPDRCFVCETQIFDPANEQNACQTAIMGPDQGRPGTVRYVRPR